MLPQGELAGHHYPSFPVLAQDEAIFFPLSCKELGETLLSLWTASSKCNTGIWESRETDGGCPAALGLLQNTVGGLAGYMMQRLVESS